MVEGAGETYVKIMYPMSYKIVSNLLSYLLLICYYCLLLQTLGNHEFDDGISSLVSYLDGIKDIPTVVSNLNLTAEPDLNKFVFPSLVFTLNHTKVGIVGYLTTDTPVIIIFITLVYSVLFVNTHNITLITYLLIVPTSCITRNI